MNKEQCGERRGAPPAAGEPTQRGHNCRAKNAAAEKPQVCIAGKCARRAGAVNEKQ